MMKKKRRSSLFVTALIATLIVAACGMNWKAIKYNFAYLKNGANFRSCERNDAMCEVTVLPFYNLWCGINNIGEACWELGLLYKSGRLHNRAGQRHPDDIQNAKRIFKKGCDLGEKSACTELDKIQQ